MKIATSVDSLKDNYEVSRESHVECYGHSLLIFAAPIMVKNITYGNWVCRGEESQLSLSMHLLLHTINSAYFLDGKIICNF